MQADDAARDPLGDADARRVVRRDDLRDRARRQPGGLEQLVRRAADLVVGLAADAAGLAHEQRGDLVRAALQLGGRGAEHAGADVVRLGRPRGLRGLGGAHGGVEIGGDATPAVPSGSWAALSSTVSVPPPAGARNSPSTKILPSHAARCCKLLHRFLSPPSAPWTTFAANPSARLGPMANSRRDGVARGHQPARRHVGGHRVARPERLDPPGLGGDARPRAGGRGRPRLRAERPRPGARHALEPDHRRDRQRHRRPVLRRDRARGRGRRRADGPPRDGLQRRPPAGGGDRVRARAARLPRRGARVRRQRRAGRLGRERRARHGGRGGAGARRARRGAGPARLPRRARRRRQRRGGLRRDGLPDLARPSPDRLRRGAGGAVHEHRAHVGLQRGDGRRGAAGRPALPRRVRLRVRRRRGAAAARPAARCPRRSSPPTTRRRSAC